MNKKAIYNPNEININSTHEDEIYVVCKYPLVKTGMYLISNYGNIYSLKINKLLIQNITDKGYSSVTLQINKKEDKKNRNQASFKVHRLVAYEFCLRDDEDKIEVDHLNCKRNDNYYLNLEWVTHEENINRIIRRGGNYNHSKEEFIRNICEKMQSGKTIFDIYYEYHPNEIKTYKNFEDFNFYKLLYNTATGKRNPVIRSEYDIDINLVYPRFNKKIKEDQIKTINNMIENGNSNLDIMMEFGYVHKSENLTLYRYIAKIRKVHRLGKG